MIDLSDWALVPGPAKNPPTSSVVLSDLTLHSPGTIAEAILSFPGMEQKGSEGGDWWSWSASWQSGIRHISIGMTLFETDPVSWGGSPLSGTCELADILGLWKAIGMQCAGVWMHNTNCDIHTPDSFEQLFSP